MHKVYIFISMCVSWMSHPRPMCCKPGILRTGVTHKQTFFLLTAYVNPQRVQPSFFLSHIRHVTSTIFKISTPTLCGESDAVPTTCWCPLPSHPPNGTKADDQTRRSLFSKDNMDMMRRWLVSGRPVDHEI